MENQGSNKQPLHVIVENAIAEDWELVKDTAGSVADRKSIFELAFKFGWHAARKHYGTATPSDTGE